MTRAKYDRVRLQKTTANNAPQTQSSDETRSSGPKKPQAYDTHPDPSAHSSSTGSDYSPQEKSQEDAEERQMLTRWSLYEQKQNRRMDESLRVIDQCEQDIAWYEKKMRDIIA